MGKILLQKEDYSTLLFNDSTIGNNDEQESMNMNLTSSYSLTYLLNMNYFALILYYGPIFDFQINNSNIRKDHFVKPQQVERTDHYEADSQNNCHKSFISDSILKLVQYLSKRYITNSIKINSFHQNIKHS